MHRNSQKRFYNKNYIYFVTVNTYQKFPYFKEKILCDLFLEELKICKQIKKFRLYAFCLNYDHFHLLLQPGSVNISKIMQFLKRHFSRNANVIMLNNKNNMINEENINQIKNESDIGQCRLRDKCYIKNKYHIFINKFDKKIINFQKQFIQKYKKNNFLIPKFKWQKSFHDHIIRNKKDFLHHYHYTSSNFLKHQLPKKWSYTSLNNPQLLDM